MAHIGRVQFIWRGPPGPYSIGNIDPGSIFHGVHILYDTSIVAIQFALNVSSRESLSPNVLIDVPKRCKRGRNGGVRERTRRMKFITPLPTMVMGNTQSVHNKMDELEAYVRFNSEYRESAVIGLSEARLDEHATDTEINLPGFTYIRGGPYFCIWKEAWWRRVFFINQCWCNNAPASAKVCLPDI